MIIINPKFQLKFSFIICSLVFLGSIIYPLTIYDLIETLINNSPANSEVYENQRFSLLMTLFIIQTGFLGFIFIVCLRVSHKIVGPIYKAKLFLAGLREGEEYYPLKFRTGDQFLELADEINSTIEYLKHRSEEEEQYLSETIAYLENLSLIVPDDKKPVLDEIQNNLKKMIS